MTTCINCGKEAEFCLCDECMNKVDVEKFCEEISDYIPEDNINSMWESIASTMQCKYNFRYIAFAIADKLQSPRKEYQKIMNIANGCEFVPKASRAWLYNTYENCRDKDGLTSAELNRIKGIVLDARYKDYMYNAETENIAIELSNADELQLPKQVYATLADYYTKTRRYDKAEEVLVRGEKIFADDIEAMKKFNNLLEANYKYRCCRDNPENGKKEYMPKADNKKKTEEIRRRYIEFLSTIGIEAAMPVTKASQVPDPIPVDEYPKPDEIRDADFDSFVAFDIETTGCNPSRDSIIEIGAVKVINGKVKDQDEFVFQKFVKPYKSKLSDEIQQLTGITPDNVKDAREMWEVTPDFMKWVGDNVLVGYNCMAFDSKYMARAGRYSHIIINNKYFDVMRYAKSFYKKLGITGKSCKLEDLAQKLEIENPRAHRALADAVTTAKIYMRLKEMDVDDMASMDDIISDVDNW